MVQHKRRDFRAGSDNHWSSLTDDEILATVWSTSDPAALENLQAAIPDDLGEFFVEFDYRLGADQAPVCCAHCTKHQKHRHGFVLRGLDGRRYLLGSSCGPTHYQAEYQIASKARSDARSRYEALDQIVRLRAIVPPLLIQLGNVEKSPDAKAARRIRGALERGAPLSLARFRRIRTHSVTGAIEIEFNKTERDLAAEQQRDERQLREVDQLTDRRLPNREHTPLANQIMKGHRQPIFREEVVRLGTLEGASWLLSAHDPTSLLADCLQRMKGWVAQLKTTQNKSTRQLRQTGANLSADVRIAEAASEEIQALPHFFEPKNLANIPTWAGEHLRGVGEMRINGAGLLCVRDSQGPWVELSPRASAQGTPRRR